MTTEMFPTATENPPMPAAALTVTVQRIETAVAEGGRVILENLPFPAGQAVEVIVLPRGAAAESPAYPLRGKPIIYYDYDPFGPAAPEEDWDALR